MPLNILNRWYLALKYFWGQRGAVPAPTHYLEFQVFKLAEVYLLDVVQGAPQARENVAIPTLNSLC